MSNEALIEELKHLLIDSLELEDITAEQIDPNDALFGDGLGLDSIDALEIGVAIQNKYKIKFASGTQENQQNFSSLTALASFITSKQDDAQ